MVAYCRSVSGTTLRRPCRTSGLSAKAGFRDVVGRGSGEAFQLKATGHGTVYVQASEERVG